MLSVTESDRRAASPQVQSYLRDSAYQLASGTAVDRFLSTYFGAKGKLLASEAYAGDAEAKREFITLFSLYAGSESTRRKREPSSLRDPLEVSMRESATLDRILKLRISAGLSDEQLFAWVSQRTKERSGQPRYAPFIAQAIGNPLCIDECLFKGFSLETRKPQAGKPLLPLGLDDFGGNPRAREEIDFLIRGFHNPQAYQQVGSRMPRGLLFYGPPGTGKTLLAKILASSINEEFHEVRLDNILSKYVGESEQNLMRMLDQPGVIFLDEFDVIGRQTRQCTTEHAENITNLLATRLDGYATNDANVYIAATNNIGGIHPKLLRPGRFDRTIHFDYLDEQGMREVFCIHLSKAEERAKRPLFDGIDIARLAKTMSSVPQVSGADVAEVVRRATERKAREMLKGKAPTAFRYEDFRDAINDYAADRHARGMAIY